jgi:pyruvate carboxylase
LDINTIADFIIQTLKTNGFTLHRYDAYSSNSVYIKLDWGVCNSIRISDHEGKKYLKYRYNIIMNGTNKTVNDSYQRYYYNQDSLSQMLSQIIHDKQQKLERYGPYHYDKFVQENRKKSINEKGFWQQAKLI